MCVSRACGVRFTFLFCALLTASVLSAQLTSVEESNNKAIELSQQGRYAEAEPYAREALRVAEATLSPNDPNLAEVLNNLGSILSAQAKYAEAEPLLKRALSIDEQVFGPEHARVIGKLNSLGQVYEGEGKYTEAEPLLARALAVAEKVDAANDPDLATAYNNLGELYCVEGKYDRAEPMYLSAIRINESALGPDAPAVAIDANNLGELYLTTGKFAEGEKYLRRALAIGEKFLKPDDPQLAVLINSLATAYDDEGNYSDALPLYQRSLAILEKAYGTQQPQVIGSLSNLGQLYWKMGNYPEAEASLLRSVRMGETALGPDHPLVGRSLANLGLLYEAEGRYTDAEQAFRRGLPILEKALGGGNPDLAAVYNNVAGLYIKLGQYDAAERLQQQALEIGEKVFGGDHPNVASMLGTLGQIYEDENRLDDAVQVLQRSQAIFEKAFGPDYTSVADALGVLASIYGRQGKYADAEPLLQRALRIKEKSLGPNHPDVALILNELAELAREQGRYADAVPLYQRALDIDDKALGPDHPAAATILFNMALACDGQGADAQAKLFYQRALDNVHQQFLANFTSMTEAERLVFLSSISGDFPGYFSFVHRYRQKDPQLAGSMYNVLLWEKGFIAASFAGMRRRIEDSGDPQAIALLSQLSAKRSQIAVLLNSPPAGGEQWRNQLSQLVLDAYNLEKSLVARSAVFAEKEKLDHAVWQQVRDALAPGEAAVEFVRFRYFDTKWTDVDYYVALVVTHDTRDEPQYIVLGESKQIEGGALLPFRQSVQTRGLASEQEPALPGEQAYRFVWQPLESALAGKTRIYISPDGVLNQVALGLIPMPDGKLLMERYDLRVLSSTKDILRVPGPVAQSTALLVGDPVFDLSEEQQRAALKKLALPEQPPNASSAPLPPDDISRDAVSKGDHLPPLPGTGAEVNTIAGLMTSHGWKVGVYLEDTALKRVVEQASSPRVLHLATHGFFFPDQPAQLDKPGTGPAEQAPGFEDPMLRSGLYFAGADRTLAGKPTAGGLDNGVLTAMEVGGLNLTRTELVVLSACNTGQGDVINGEGVFGLRRALQEAGAHAVLMSLWSVPDKETQELMQRFYAKWLSGTEMHQALKEAQLEMREKVRSEHNGHDLPYYWGAFILVGK